MTEVFVSYARANQSVAKRVESGLKASGFQAWRDDQLPAHRAYSDIIEQRLREASAVVVLWSKEAAQSQWVRAEADFARSEGKLVQAQLDDTLPPMPFNQIQCADLSGWRGNRKHRGWAKLVQGVTCVATGEKPQEATRQRSLPMLRRGILAITAGAMLLLVIAGAWFLLQPSAVAAHTKIVRLTAFQLLSEDLPATMPPAVRDEVIAAFNADGVVGVSTASAPSPGAAPAYALTGTIRRDGDRIRVITRLSNERSGVTLWSGGFAFDADQPSRVPRQIAVHAGNVLRCGLFGASTYPKSMPDPVLSDYLNFCHYYWVELESGKMLHWARRAVAAAPDFSSGWSAVAIAAGLAMFEENPGPRRESLRSEALEAAARALALDPMNSEALAAKAPLMNAVDFSAQEALLKRAIAARPLDCGCEHWQYAVMLQNVGRHADAAAEAARAVDILAFDRESQLALAKSLLVLGKREVAKQHFSSVADLDLDPAYSRDVIALTEATETGDYAAGISALASPKLQIPAAQRAALVGAFRAIASGNAAVKSQAAKALLALPDDQQNYVVVRTLGALGATDEALQSFVKGINSRYDWPSLLWYPSMRAVLDEPAFPALADRLGLMKYWRTTRTRPDVCASKDPPPVCRML